MKKKFAQSEGIMTCPSDSEKPTLPAMKAVRETREDVKDLSSLPREREIDTRICSTEKLDPLLLKCRTASRRGKELVFLDYYCEENNTVYAYIDKKYKDPDLRGPDDEPIPLSQPGASVLLRIEADGKVTEMHRWEDSEEENKEETE
jgi:hypothetical protein